MINERICQYLATLFGCLFCVWFWLCTIPEAFVTPCALQFITINAFLINYRVWYDLQLILFGGIRPWFGSSMIQRLFGVIDGVIMILAMGFTLVSPLGIAFWLLALVFWNGNGRDYRFFSENLRLFIRDLGWHCFFSEGWAYS